MDNGRWTMDDGRWTMDDGQWSMVMVMVMVMVNVQWSMVFFPVCGKDKRNAKVNISKNNKNINNEILINPQVSVRSLIQSFHVIYKRAASHFITPGSRVLA